MTSPTRLSDAVGEMTEAADERVIAQNIPLDRAREG